LKQAKLEDKKLVADILVSAFAPIEGASSINLLVKQDHKRIQRMHVLMEYLFEKAFYAGEVYVSNNDKACLLLLFPHKEKTNLRSILADLKLAFKCITIGRISKVLKWQKTTKQNFPTEPHIRPLILGVQPEAKGNGTAARLMIEVKNKYKGNTLPAMVDAANEKNVKLYEKFGFRVTRKEYVSGVPIWFLRINLKVSEEEFLYHDGIAEMLKTLGHSLRISIIKLLSENEQLSVTEIFTQLGIEQAVASHHLRLLKSAGIVSVSKSGKHSYYYISNDLISEIYKLIKSAQ